ncbi:unnamed protein product, partial [Tenebrio molitor]
MNNISQIYGWQILATFKTIILVMVGMIYYVSQLFNMGLSNVMFMLSNVLTTTLLILYGFLIFFSCDEANKMTTSVLLLCQNL